MILESDFCNFNFLNNKVYKIVSINPVMKRGTKGLSTIVATLIIILLVFVAVGIVWVVVRNLVTGGSEQLDLTSKCLETTVTPTKVMSSGANYNITVLRSGGNYEIGGIKLIFTSESSDSNFVYDSAGNIGNLNVKTIPVTVQDVSSPDKVKVVVYFLEKSGNQQYCQGGEEYNF